MELWTSVDYERPFETYPGYLGHFFDGDFHAEPELKPLQSFDFRKYGELLEEHGGERQLRLPLASGVSEISIAAYDHIVHVLDQLPTIKVCLDNGPPDAGPASGGTYVFFVADGVSELDLKASIAALTVALLSDFTSLEKGRAQ